MSKARELAKWEVEAMAIQIASINPERLQPHHRVMFEGIRDWFNRGMTRGSVWLSDKQIAAIRRCKHTSDRTQEKLDRPSFYSAEDRLNVFGKPIGS